MADKVNLRDAFASFAETWSPRIAADVDDFQVKLAKLEGEFVWHAHPDAGAVPRRPRAPAAPVPRP